MDIEQLKTEIDSLKRELEQSKTNFDGLSSTVKDWSEFQLKAPLDPFTRRLIGDTVNGDGTYLTATSTNTVTNKRITKRFGSTASAGTLTIDGDSYDIYAVTAQAAGLTVASPSGTPTHGQPLLIRIKDNGTSRAITWNAIFRVIGVTLPANTVISKYNYVGCVYNSTDSKWDVIMSLQEV